jgi:protein SCO1
VRSIFRHRAGAVAVEKLNFQIHPRANSVRLFIVPLIRTFGIALSMALASIAHGHDDTRPAALRDVAFEQKLDGQIPRDLNFVDERGASVRLGDYFGRKPVILNFVYYKCQDLCPLLLDGITRTMRALAFDVGKEFDVVTVSIDPSDSAALAAAKKKDFITRYGRSGAEAGWHFLRGDGSAIHKLTEAAGFHYTYDPRTGEFAHATGIVLVTPKGKISRYYYGIDFSPRDLRLGLIEAASGKIGTPIDQLLLFCYHYDPVTGKYGLVITNVIRLAGVGTVFILAGFIFLLLRRERAHGAANGGTA